MADSPGSPVALMRQLHDEHAAALWGYCLRLTGNDRSRAEDVVQETLLRAWRSLPALDESQGSVRAWLFTVARNLVIDDRRSARFTRELQSDNLPERPSLDAIGPAVDKWVLADALKSLSSEHRNAIVRAYYLGQTVADIAAKEQIPEGTVKSRLHYALRALRIALQERGVGRD